MGWKKKFKKNSYYRVIHQTKLDTWFFFHSIKLPNTYQGLKKFMIINEKRKKTVENCTRNIITENDKQKKLYTREM